MVLEAGGSVSKYWLRSVTSQYFRAGQIRCKVVNLLRYPEQTIYTVVSPMTVFVESEDDYKTPIENIHNES